MFLPRESRLKVHLLVHLSTKCPEQTTQITAHTQRRVQWEDNPAQTQNSKLDSFPQFGTNLAGQAAHTNLQILLRSVTQHPQLWNATCLELKRHILNLFLCTNFRTFYILRHRFVIAKARWL